MKKIIAFLVIGLFFIIVLLLTSCGITKVGFQERQYDGLKVGELHEDLGNPLIASGAERFAEGIKLNQKIDVIVRKEFYLSWVAQMYKGETLYLGGNDSQNEYYFSANTNTGGVASQPQKYYQGVCVNKTTKETFAFCEINTRIIKKKIKVEFTEKTYSDNLCNNCFQRELIYNGISGNIIKMIYREFIDNMARANFTQDLNYDLGQSNIISFKGCKLEVIDAKNTGIKYKILTTFNQ
jgi:hypothetical protein